MNSKVFLLILLFQVCGVGAQILFKKGVNSLPTYRLSTISGYFLFIKHVLTVPAIWMGMLMITCGVTIWLIVLDYTELSFAYPFDSIQYIILPAASYVFLREQINWKRILGTLFIVSGILFVSLS